MSEQAKQIAHDAWAHYKLGVDFEYDRIHVVAEMIDTAHNDAIHQALLVVADVLPAVGANREELCTALRALRRDP